jgi:hypothetical protein
VVKAGVHPYEIQFQCFTSELDDVFNRLVAAQNAYVIKVVNIERGTASDDSGAAATPLAVVNPMQAMMARYGRMMPQPAAAPAAATTGKIGEIVLEQKPIKVTLGIEVVRLIPEPEPAAGSSARPRRQEPKL